MSSQVEISIFPDGPAYTKQVAEKSLKLEFNELKTIICEKSWSPFTFNHVVNAPSASGRMVTGAYRTVQNCKLSNCFALDFDDGFSMIEVKKICESKNLNYIIGTTKSHQKEKNGKPACDRFRLIIELSRVPKNAEEYHVIWNYFNVLFMKHVDSSCRDLARFYYQCIEIIFEKYDSAKFDVDVILQNNNKTSEFKPDDLKNIVGEKGQLFDSTVAFLENGLIEENWHLTFIKAAGDMRDQNYDINEAELMLQKAAKFYVGFLDQTDLMQLADIYRRERRYSFRPKKLLNQNINIEISEINQCAFHGVIGEFVKVLENHTEADPVGILVQIIGLIGNMVGRNKYYLVESTKHYTNIFSVMVGKTAGGRKGTGFDRALAIMEIVSPAWFKACYVPGGLASGEGLIHRVSDNPKDEESVVPRPREKRLFVQESEFASVLKVATRESNTLSVMIRNSWDKGNLQNLSKHNKEKATNAHISINGHITRDELLKYLSTTESSNGFANRFLWVSVKRSKILPHGGQFSKENIQPFVKKFSDILSFGFEPGEMKFDEQAKILWSEIYHAFAEENREGVYAAITARAEPNILRLAMIFAITDKCNLINVHHLNAAKAIWDYCDQTCLAIYGKATGDETVDKILKLVTELGGEASRTQIRDLFSRNVTKSEIDRAIGVIESKGLAKRTYRKANGTITEYLVGIKNEVH